VRRTERLIAIALQVAPQDVCLCQNVVRKRTTEAGLDVLAHLIKVAGDEKLSDAAFRRFFIYAR